MGVDLFTDITMPVITVLIEYPGASPDEVEGLMTKPIEDAMVGINGTDRIRPLSQERLLQVIVIFKSVTDMVDDSASVCEKVAQVRGNLPDEVKELSISRADVDASPILIYTVKSKDSISTARLFINNTIKPALEQVDGVSSIDIFGGRERRVWIELDRNQIDTLNLDATTIAARVQAENVNIPSGHFDKEQQEISVRTLGEFEDVEMTRDIIVTSSHSTVWLFCSDSRCGDGGRRV
ncbi:efflux RND transporter permease subunit [Pajaroellobacter abortibovis]|uniref:Acriflavin resistance protein n=1 Tax=Pajaroellobacter abortibovis TaxID=1882918 RepID=A0A1L6MUZ7_9BACT|nr:efflux RND transporter permease subunit [Pajaroellobacter abortibovis]APR99344.1 hypothetical protein BCY86_00615 [Pajaroellobacter abortibovis]